MPLGAGATGRRESGSPPFARSRSDRRDPRGTRSLSAETTGEGAAGCLKVAMETPGMNVKLSPGRPDLGRGGGGLGIETLDVAGGGGCEGAGREVS